MKYRVEFNPEARADLLGLYDYIAEQSGEDRALSYIVRIEEACLSLETFPLRGKLLKGIRPGLRVLGFERRVCRLRFRLICGWSRFFASFTADET